MQTQLSNIQLKRDRFGQTKPILWFKIVHRLQDNITESSSKALKNATTWELPELYPPRPPPGALPLDPTRDFLRYALGEGHFNIFPRAPHPLATPLNYSPPVTNRKIIPPCSSKPYSLLTASSGFPRKYMEWIAEIKWYFWSVPQNFWKVWLCHSYSIPSTPSSFLVTLSLYFPIDSLLGSTTHAFILPNFAWSFFSCCISKQPTTKYH